MGTNTNKEALVAVEKLMKFDLASVGIDSAKLMTPDKARAYLAQNGVPVKGISDVAAQLVQTATKSLNQSANASYNASVAMGVLSDCEAWKAAFAPDGKRYKSENAYLRDFFPGYAVSTTSIYADVGKSIYLPILQKLPGYEGMEYLLKVSPSNVKYLLSVIKDDEKRALLPAALEDAQGKGKITQRVLAALAKDISKKVESADSTETANLPDGTNNPEQVANDLNATLPGTNRDIPANATIEARVRMCIMAAKNDTDELCMNVPEQFIMELVTLFSDGAGNANTAMTICNELAKIVTTAMKVQ